MLPTAGFTEEGEARVTTFCKLAAGNSQVKGDGPFIPIPEELVEGMNNVVEFPVDRVVRLG